MQVTANEGLKGFNTEKNPQDLQQVKQLEDET